MFDGVFADTPKIKVTPKNVLNRIERWSFCVRGPQAELEAAHAGEWQGHSGEYVVKGLSL